MPLNQYHCQSCDHGFETLQKHSEKTLKQCPECNEMSLVKVICAPNFQLGGSGWYKDGYGTKQTEQKES